MATLQPVFDHFTNPVDMVEHIATIHQWNFERNAPDELTLTVSERPRLPTDLVD